VEWAREDQMQIKYDLLVYLVLIVFVIVVAIAAFVLVRTPERADIETRKIRVAAVMLTGILTLFVFTSVLYFVEPAGAGKEIFDRAFTAMFTLAGTIVGYLFGSAKAANGNELRPPRE
jgi:cytochrome bd-type quinol oxidase subunit 2